MRPPPPPSCTVLAASSSRCARTMPTTSSPSTSNVPGRRAERLVVLADLVRLGPVGIEVVLAVERRAAGDLGSPAPARPRSPARPPRGWRPAARPGAPRQTGQMRVFGSPPNRFGQRQNILSACRSWTWISRPMTAPSRPARSLRPPPAAGGTRIERERAAPARARPSQQPVLGERRARSAAGPTGRPSESPQGIEIAGRPARLTRQREDVAGVHRERVVDALADRGTRPSARSASSSRSQLLEGLRRSRAGSACARAAPGRSRRRSSPPTARRCRS